MSSRLLADLENRAKNATDRVDWSRSVCKIAMHCARQGQFDRASDCIKSIRQFYGVELQYEVASWVMLAEGVLHFSKAEMHQAYDRLRRAYGLAVALKTETARPSCAAWMALIEFNAGKYEDMAQHLVEVMKDAEVDDHQARGRASLVLADGLQVAGRFDLAKRWYETSRVHATAEGDQAMLSARLYNVAVFRTANLRLADVFGEVSESELKRASMEANSSFTYDMAVGATSFGTLWRLMHSQLLIIQREYSEAKILLDSIKMDNLVPRDIPLVLCDLAWCELLLGNIESSAIAAKAAEENISKLSEPDDLAFALCRLSQIKLKNNDEVGSARLRAEAEKNLHLHREFQNTLLKQLEVVISKISSP